MLAAWITMHSSHFCNINASLRCPLLSVGTMSTNFSKPTRMFALLFCSDAIWLALFWSSLSSSTAFFLLMFAFDLGFSWASSDAMDEDDEWGEFCRRFCLSYGFFGPFFMLPLEFLLLLVLGWMNSVLICIPPAEFVLVWWEVAWKGATGEEDPNYKRFPFRG